MTEYYKKVWAAYKKHKWSGQQLYKFLKDNEKVPRPIALKNLQKEINNGHGR